MKPMLIIATLLFCSGATHAQSFSAGLRSGLSYWCQGNMGNKISTLPGSHLSIDPEVFARYTAKKRLAFEAAIGTSCLRYSTVSRQYTGGVTYANVDTIYNNYNTKVFGLTLAVQYELFCPSVKKNSFWRKLHNYVGISVNPLLITGVQQEEYRTNQDPQNRLFENRQNGIFTYKNKSLQLWAGINHTLCFELNKRLSLMMVSAISVRPGVIMENGGPDYPYDPTAKFGFSLGGFYKL